MVGRAGSCPIYRATAEAKARLHDRQGAKALLGSKPRPVEATIIAAERHRGRCRLTTLMTRHSATRIETATLLTESVRLTSLERARALLAHPRGLYWSPSAEKPRV